MTDNRDTADETSFPFRDLELIAIGPRMDKLPEEAGNVGLERRVEAAFARIDGPVQADEGAEVARPEVVSQGESRGRIRGWIFEWIHAQRSSSMTSDPPRDVTPSTSSPRGSPRASADRFAERLPSQGLMRTRGRSYRDVSVTNCSDAGNLFSIHLKVRRLE